MEGPFRRGSHEFIPPPPRVDDDPPKVLYQRETNQELGLSRGRRYRVVKPFRDNDGHTHPVGVEWVFVAAFFDPNYSLTTLCVRLDSGDEWRIPLSGRRDGQTEILSHPDEYLVLIVSTPWQNFVSMMRRWSRRVRLLEGVRYFFEVDDTPLSQKDFIS